MGSRCTSCPSRIQLPAAWHPSNSNSISPQQLVPASIRAFQNYLLRLSHHTVTRKFALKPSSRPGAPGLSALRSGQLQGPQPLRASVFHPSQPLSRLVVAALLTLQLSPLHSWLMPLLFPAKLAVPIKITSRPEKTIWSTILIRPNVQQHGGNMKTSCTIYFYSPGKHINTRRVNEELCLHQSQHSLQFNCFPRLS